jgi:hypothetical protein
LFFIASRISLSSASLNPFSASWFSGGWVVASPCPGELPGLLRGGQPLLVKLPVEKSLILYLYL